MPDHLGKKNYIEPRISLEDLEQFEYLLDHPDTTIAAESGAIQKIRDHFHKLLSIPERAAKNMVDEELRARAARQQERQNYHGNEQPESQET